MDAHAERQFNELCADSAAQEYWLGRVRKLPRDERFALLVRYWKTDRFTQSFGFAAWAAEQLADQARDD